MSCLCLGSAPSTLPKLEELLRIIIRRVSVHSLGNPAVHRFGIGSRYSRFVELTHHNANQLEIGSELVKVSWSNQFHDPQASARRSEVQRQRHQEDLEFHTTSLKTLKRSREDRYWSEERILRAIRDFHSKEGRPPSYYDFGNTEDLPDYTTLWRRLGSLQVAISRALATR